VYPKYVVDAASIESRMGIRYVFVCNAYLNKSRKFTVYVKSTTRSISLSIT